MEIAVCPLHALLDLGTLLIIWILYAKLSLKLHTPLLLNELESLYGVIP